MDSNSELLLKALRYFNDNRYESKTKVGLEKYLGVNTGGADNILYDLENSKCVEKKTSDPDVWQMASNGEVKINELQRSKDSESTRITIWSATVIIGVIQIIIGFIQIWLACESSCTNSKELESPKCKTLILNECIHCETHHCN